MKVRLNKPQLTVLSNRFIAHVTSSRNRETLEMLDVYHMLKPQEKVELGARVRELLRRAAEDE